MASKESRRVINLICDSLMGIDYIDCQAVFVTSVVLNCKLLLRKIKHDLASIVPSEMEGGLK